MEESGNHNKIAALQFLHLTSIGKVSEAFDLYVASDFRHHNMYFKGDAHSLKTAMEESAINLPAKQLEIQFALQEGNRVAVYSKVTISPGEPGIALVHFFLFSGAKIVELWDLAQAPPEEVVNENGLF